MVHHIGFSLWTNEGCPFTIWGMTDGKHGAIVPDQPLRSETPWGQAFICGDSILSPRKLR